MRIKFFILTFLLLFFGVKSTFAVNQLDVVINEVAWMGTTASYNDEWIELYNTTDNSITLDGWILEAEDGTPKINLSGTMNPKSYYLLERTNDNTISDITADLIYSNALGNEGEKLILKSSSTVVIDQINASSGWFAGDNSTKSTMERINPLDSGDKSINWAINNGSKRNGIDESGNQINGTPKNQNSVYLSTSTLSPSPTPAPSSSSTPQVTSSFTISNVPPQINSDQSFTVLVNLALPDKPNTKFYLKGAFRKSGSTNYFGFTKVSGNWIKNSNTYTDQFPTTTDQSGNWTGNLEIKPDPDDSGYTGSDNYSFKVGKYDSTDTSPSVSWSDNESTINIIATAQTTEQTTAPTSKPSSSTNPANTPSSINSKSILTDVTSQSKVRYQVASIAGITSATASATSSAKIDVKNQKQTNLFIWIGLIFIFAGAGAIGYIYLKKNEKLHFPFGR